MMYSWLLQNAAMPMLSRMTRSRYWDVFQEMLRFEQQSHGEQDDAQFAQLSELLEGAYRDVPFYRTALDRAGVTPADVTAIEDLARLPVLTKRLIQRNFPDQITATGGDRSDWQYVSTRGTADRLTAVNDFYKRDRIRAAAARALYLSGGYRVGQAMAEIPPDICNIVCGDEGQEIEGVLPHVWRMVREGKLRDSSAVSDLRGLIERGWVLRKKTYPPFGPDGTNLPAARLEAYAERLRVDRPTVLKALPSYLLAIARHVVERKQSPLPVGAVKPMGGSVSPVMRRLIERGFAGEYREDYGSAEFGDMACDCSERDGLHVFSDLFVVEVVREGRIADDGELGKILITDLSNRTMPFIRYEIGDVGRMSRTPCPCGRSAPRLWVEGRLQDTLVAEDGRVFTPDAVMDFFYTRPEIDQYQLVERRPGDFELLLVPGRGEVDEAALTEQLAELLGGGATIDAFRVKTIQPESGGKFRFVKSRSYERLG